VASLFKILNPKVAGAKGLEPSAFCVTGRRYNQLNYAPVEVAEKECCINIRILGFIVKLNNRSIFKKVLEIPR